MKAFGIAVQTEQAQRNQVLLGKHAAVCSLEVRDRPDSVTLRIGAKGNGVSPIAIQAGIPHEYANDLAYDLTVPVSRKIVNNVWVPHTRVQNQDNVDIIVVDGNLYFEDIQVSLLTRKGRFYIAVQRVYAGWMRIVEDEVHFVPSDSVYAYPGADYRGTWKNMGQVLATMTRVTHAVLETLGGRLPDVASATWQPKEVQKLGGWSRGHLLFFNPITNYGHLLGEDGNKYFVYGNNLVDVRGPVHLLEPMAPVYYRPGQQDEGKLPSAKSCKPA